MNPEQPTSPPSTLLFKVVNGKQIGTKEGPIHSPFTAIKNQVLASTFTADDLLPSLPSEVLAANINPATPVGISRETIEKALRTGKASLPLHEVYQACPSLFSQPIAPTDERRVALPPAKIVHLLALIKEDSTATNTTAAMTSSESHLPVGKGHPARDSKNTIFTVDSDEESSSTPFESTPAPVTAPSPPSPEPSPFSIAQTGPKETADLTPTVPTSPVSASVSPFDRITALSTAQTTPVQEPVVTAQTATPEKKKVILPINTVLQFANEDQIGIDPQQLPGSVQVQLSEELFHRQLANGEKPCVRVAEIRAGLIPEHKVLLAAARPEAIIRIPVDQFQADEAKPAQASSPVASPPPSIPPHLEVLPPPVSNSQSSPFIDASQSSSPSIDEDEQDPFASMSALPEWPIVSSNPSQPTTQTQTAGANPFSFPPIPGIQEAPNEEHLQPSHLSTPATNAASAFPPAPAALFSANPSPPKPLSIPVRIGNSSLKPINKHRRMLLRVLLGTHEDVDFEGAIHHICRLPGVSAVACIRNHQLHTFATDGSSEAENFVRQAPILQQHLLPLSNLAGLENTEIVTLRSENRLTSFALNSELTLGILHNAGPNETELLERITLLTTELAAMLAADSPA